MKMITGEEFRSEIASGVVLVDFFAVWCGPCKMIAPILEDLSTEMEGRAKFFKVDIDNNQDLAREFQITAVPTSIIFKDGAVAEKLVGFVQKDQIISKLESVIG